MKNTIGIIVSLFFLAADLFGSVADNVRDSFKYDRLAHKNSQGVFAKPPQENIIFVEFHVRTPIDRELDARFAPKPVKASALDALDRFTFIANIEENSILGGIIDKINQINDAYRDMRSGFDTSFMGASFTVYARSKIEWNVGRAKTIELKYAGEKSLSFVWAF